MEAELEESSRDNKALLLAIENHELKLKATTKEMHHERQQVYRQTCWYHIVYVLYA